MLSGGTVTISGTTESIELDEASDHSYAPAAPPPNPLWSGGETLTAANSGSADVPALTVSVTAPQPITVLSPLPADPAPTLDANSDFTLTWEPTVAPVNVTLSVAVPNSDGSGMLYSPGAACSFTSSDDSGTSMGTVPSSILSSLQKPNGFAGYQLDVFTTSLLQNGLETTIGQFQATWMGYSSLIQVQ
jgi:hypothetical protein